jgi:VWFA-related protein
MRFVCFVCFVVCSSATSAAQQTPFDSAQGRPTFRTGTTLIEFSIVAVDRDGKPVTDLRMDEVSIREDDQPRDVAFFQFEGATGKGREPEPLPEGIFTNRSEYTPGPPRNLTAIVLDTINTSPSGQALAVAQVLRYLQKLPPGSRIGLYRLGQQTAVLHDFTEDIESLRARIARHEVQADAQKTDAGRDFAGVMQSTSDEKRQAMAEMAAVEARVLQFFNDGLRDRRLATTLAGLEALGNHLAGIPGRKNMVWISDSLPMVRFAGGFRTVDKRVMERTARRLASQGIAIYPVDARGVEMWDSGVGAVSSGSSKGQRPPPPRTYLGISQEQQNRWATMDLWAGVTGGRVVKLTNDPTEGVTAAETDLRATYSLGFYAGGEPDSRWHALKVIVRRPGVSLRYSQGYLAAATAVDVTENWEAARWREVAYNPLGSTAIRLDVKCELASDTLNAVLQIAGSDLHFRRSDKQLVADLDVAIAENTSTGPTTIRHEDAAIRFQDDPVNDPRSGVVRFTRQWTVSSRTSRIRLIVRDRITGRYGTLDIPVNEISSSK